MKKILGLLLLLSSTSYAQSVEFTLLQSQVVYHLNKSNGNLVAVIKDLQGGICLHKMDLKTKDSSGNVFLYERTDTDRGKQFYQRFELNLLSNQVNLFTSARNRNSIIPITQRVCSANCMDISVIPPCSA